jgi:hypothetical protein
MSGRPAAGGHEGAPLTLRSLPQVPRDRIVLPDGVLERIERQAFGIADHASGCGRAAGTCAAGCCSTARPGRARRSPRCT